MAVPVLLQQDSMTKNTPETNRTPAVDEPKGDLGHGNKTWSPDEGEQGISNRPDDEADGVPDGDEADDAAAFNGDDDAEEEEDDGEDDEEEEEEDDEDEPDDARSNQIPSVGSLAAFALAAASSFESTKRYRL